ncbi:hypothetical protein [Nostoc sp.]
MLSRQGFCFYGWSRYAIMHQARWRTRPFRWRSHWGYLAER